MTWVSNFEKALMEQKDAEALIGILDTQKTAHAHTANAASKSMALKLLTKWLNKDPLHKSGFDFCALPNDTPCL